MLTGPLLPAPLLRAGRRIAAAAGRRIDDEVLAHISPAHNENINFFGSIGVDTETELAELAELGPAKPARLSQV